MSPAASRTSTAMQVRTTSRLLPELLRGFEPGDRITVLDLGPGNASTVNFLARFKSKIYFADLTDNPAIAANDMDTSRETLAGFIQRQLAIPAGTQIDICLFWDYLHFIDLKTIDALSQVLQPLLHSNSRGYGFGALHGGRPEDVSLYGIADVDTLTSITVPSQPKYIPHSQQKLSEHLLSLKIARGTLLREGRLELLFESL
ncbi:MAG: hypothetical protein NXH95_09455 [Pseudomonadaceae bacterium]|nr:hypothetical protein [Pseudomonadaceae bacterium]